MTDFLNNSQERKNNRYQKLKQKAAEEYKNTATIMRSRTDYRPEFEYFLDLVSTPFSSTELHTRVQKPLVGLFCIQAPFELLSAFDLHPVKLCSGSQLVQRVSSSFLPVIMCPMLKSFIGNFELQQDGFDSFKSVIIPTTCDWVVKLPEIMQKSNNNIHYLELPHLKETERSQELWFEEIYRLKNLLEKITGIKLTRQKLTQAVNKYSENWLYLNELTELKRQGKIAAIWYTIITNSFMLDKTERWLEKLKTCLTVIKNDSVITSSAKVFVAGSPIIFPNIKLLQLIEDADMQTCADDLCSSERLFPGGILYNDISIEGIMHAIAERYHKACICPTFVDNERRINNITTIAKKHDIKGVVYNLLKGCHPYDIEAITIEQKLKEQGLKFIKIETDYGNEDSQNILTRLEAFRQTL